MTDLNPLPAAPMEGHSHVFLGAGHERNERRVWAVIALCSVMMLVEIVGGTVFGSLAVVADGLHMSTHATALLIAAVAYTYARRRASDPSFAFGTGKLGDLAGFTSAIVLAMIALLIGYEAVTRLLARRHPLGRHREASRTRLLPYAFGPLRQILACDDRGESSRHGRNSAVAKPYPFALEPQHPLGSSRPESYRAARQHTWQA